MNIILLGAPGSGKGSQAEAFVRDYGMVQISTGDLLRTEVKNGSDFGEKAKVYMENGELVPDELVTDILAERILRPDCSRGVIFDGYPRTVNQAALLESLLDQKGQKLNAVVNINVPFKVIFQRLTSRRVCNKCGKGYNLISRPPKGDKCDDCGGDIITRDDDTEEVINTRLDVYSKSTEPLIDYYRAKGLLIDIDGDRKVETIYEELQRTLKEKIGM